MGYSKLTFDAYIRDPEAWNMELPKWALELNNKGYESVSAIDFYDDIFGEDLEESCVPEDYKTGEYGGIAIERVKKLDEYGNVVFGYTDVYDQHVFKMEGYDDKIKIGLWHGTIYGSKNDAGTG